MQCVECGKSFYASPRAVRSGSKCCSWDCRKSFKRREGFWARVDKNGPVVRAELGNCWIWRGATYLGSGYGRWFAGKYYGAHRYAWLLTHGREPQPCGLHKCDVPLCVRPDHIFEGDRPTNQADMAAKGRSARGTRNGQARLTEPQVLEIRRCLNAGERAVSVSARFGISLSHTYAIRSRELWAHTPDAAS